MLLNTRPAWALDCVEETQFYNNWNLERLYADSDLFSGSENLPWGTEVCPIALHKRWMTTWIKVRLDNGDTGWVNEDDLATVAEFKNSLRARHAAKIDELNELLTAADDMESLMLKLGMAIPQPDIHVVLLSWIRAEEPAADVQTSAPKPTPTLQPTPTVRPTPTPTRRPKPTRTPRPRPTPTATSDPLGFWNDGTLHESRLSEWRQASVENRLATMADFIVRILEAEGLQAWVDFTLEDVQAYAYFMVAAVDEVAADPEVGFMSTSETVVMLWLLSFPEGIDQ